MSNATLFPPAQPPAATATKSHRISYRECIALVSDGLTIDPEQQEEYAEAIKLLGVSKDDFDADVIAFKTAEQLRVQAANREQLNGQILRANELATAFEAEVKKRRGELIDGRNALLGQLESANAAATRLANIERTNPRLYGA